MRIQSLNLPDRPYQTACLEPVENELKRRGHTVIRSEDPLPEDEVDGTLLTSYLYVRDEYFRKVKKPIFLTEHSVSVVKSGYRKDFHPRVDYLMVSGPIWKERALHLDPKCRNLYDAGFPKSDELYNNMNDCSGLRKEVIGEFGLDPHEPIIIYAPTFWDPDCYNPGSSEAIDEIENMGFKNLLVCFHDFDKIGAKKTGRRYIRTPNKNRYLLASDLMISDHSSIVLEYAILNRPIVQVNTFKDLEYFNIWREKDHGVFQIGEIARPGGIKQAVDRALANPKEWEFLRKYWVERAFYNVGKASKVTVDKMEEVLA